MHPEKSVLLYDLETNGLLKDLDRIHCAVVKQSPFTTEPQREFTSACGRMPLLPTWLSSGPTRVAHNGIAFDDRAIEKVYGIKLDPATIRDTLVMSRMAWPDLKQRDFHNLNKRPKPYSLPTRLSNGSKAIGSHSLEAWGYRLNCHKGDYKGGWEEFNQDMLDYCVQDVVVLEKLWELLQGTGLPDKAVLLEQDFHRAIMAMEERGVCFHSGKARALERTLSVKIAEIDDHMRTRVPPFVDVSYTPVKKLKRVKEVPFNAQSRAHVARYFQEQYGWKPTLRTEPTERYPEGQIKTGAEVLELLPYPEATMLAERSKMAKILGYVSSGKGSWLNFVRDDDRIYGRVHHMGTVTSRCSHYSPNLGNIPKNGELGQMCRELFVPADGLKMVGADASGLELRCLANRLTPYDGGAYAKIILDGDIHAANQKAAGLQTRNQAKTFIYAWLYGAGVDKLGSIVGGGEAEGRRMKKKFLEATPGVREWVEDVKSQAISEGYVVALDGRKVPIPHGKNPRTGDTELLDYVAPNYQLQSDGAVVMKQATVLTKQGVDVRCSGWQVLSVHDEYQYEVEPYDTERVGKIQVQAIRDAGEELGMSVELDGEYKVGDNWSETH